ncbi:citryl-CoA lyase [Candidatus Zixiibacteriota bacterium]
MAENLWKTALTQIKPGEIRVRGYDITELMGNVSYAQAAYLMLKGELPSEAEARLMEAILVASIDHGATPPSVLAARTVLSGGNSLNASVAAGVMTIGDVHGGAIEQCARILQERAVQEGSPATIAVALVEELRQHKKRMPGFGHRLHGTDPRTLRLLDMAKETGFSGRHIDLAVHIEAELEKQLGKRLPLNVDGAVGAVISDMGFDWRLGKGFFIISRTAGLVAHVYEEWTRERPMRKLGPPPSEYDGPGERTLGK